MEYFTELSSYSQLFQARTGVSESDKVSSGIGMQPSQLLIKVVKKRERFQSAARFAGNQKKGCLKIFGRHHPGHTLRVGTVKNCYRQKTLSNPKNFSPDLGDKTAATHSKNHDPAETGPDNFLSKVGQDCHLGEHSSRQLKPAEPIGEFANLSTGFILFIPDTRIPVPDPGVDSISLPIL